MSHKSGVAGKDVYLYAGVMTEAHQATTYCLMTLHRPSATPLTHITTTLGLFHLEYFGMKEWGLPEDSTEVPSSKQLLIDLTDYRGGVASEQRDQRR